MTKESLNQTTLDSPVFVSYASQDAANRAATSTGVVRQSHVPGRRGSIPGACGKNVLFFTPRPLGLRDYTQEISTRFTFLRRYTRTPFATRCSR
jgi:hypothetical protein